MPLQEALTLARDVQLLEADEPGYRAAFEEILDALERRSPLVEPSDLGLGCAYVGLDGLAPMHGGEARLIETLLKAAPSAWNPRIGVACGKFPAYLAAVTSLAGRATKVLEDCAAFLARLSVDFLPLMWEKKTRLRQLGLRTLGQVAAVGVGPLQAQFGKEGRRAWELARGIDVSPLVPRQREETVVEHLTFPAPAVTVPVIMAGLETLAARAFARPELRSRCVRAAELEGQALRRAPWVKPVAFKEAIGGKDRLLFVVKNILEAAALPGPLEDLRLTLRGLTGESGSQSSLFSNARRHEQLAEAARQLEARLGFAPPLYQVRELEPWSSLPERRHALIPFDP